MARKSAKKIPAANGIPAAPDPPLPLRLEWVDPAELAANGANWRTHPPLQMTALADAIAEVGWAGALLYNERSQRLVDGHARKDLFAGKGKVPVLIGSWTDEQERKILATLDPLSALATADAGKLDALLREVSTDSAALLEMLAGLADTHGLLSEAPPLPAAGTFGPSLYTVTLADPPWQYHDQRTGGVTSGAASAQYPTMPTDAICALTDRAGKPLRECAADNAVLFLWATAPCLPDAMQVIEAWGFAYKAQFVWDKVRGYNGHYNDVQHELLLVALCGSFQPQTDTLHKSIVTCEKTKHSRKPEVFYDIIESMYPVNLETPTHLEAFARKTKRPGWDTWGNEA